MAIGDFVMQFLQQAANQATGTEPAVGINPELHPRGSRTRSAPDPLAAILAGKQQTLQNIRSPMVRRSAGGRVVDENQPEGLDWLEANGPSRSGQPTHSWDQPRYSPFGGGGAEQPPGPAPAQMTQSASGVRSMMGPYGGGFSTGVDEPLLGEFSPPSPYRDVAPGQPYNPLDPTTEPMLADEQDALASNVQSAYNETMTNPRQSPAAGQVARSRALDRTSQGIRSGAIQSGYGLGPADPLEDGPPAPAEQPGSVTMPSNPPGVNSYTPFAEAPMQNSPLFDPAVANAPENRASVRADAVGGDDPGWLLRLLRQGGVNAARAGDVLAGTVRTRQDDPYEYENAMTSWLLGR